MAGRGHRYADDLVRRYLDEIGRYPLLAAGDEVELARAVEAGRSAATDLAAGASRFRGTSRPGRGPAEEAELRRRVAAGEEARRRFIQSNLRLVVSVAKRHQRSGLPLLDLIQEGNLGLIRAVEKFDPGHGCRFSTYAMWWIRQAIARGVAEKGRTIRVPLHLIDAARQVSRSTERLSEVLGRPPSVSELAHDADLSVAAVEDAQRLVLDPVSLQAPVGRSGDEGELADVIVDPDGEAPFEAAFAALRTDAVRAALAALPDREQQVLTLRFGLAGAPPRTLDQVGRQFRLTRERIRQIEAKALSRLRHPASHPGGGVPATARPVPGTPGAPRGGAQAVS